MKIIHSSYKITSTQRHLIRDWESILLDFDVLLVASNQSRQCKIKSCQLRSTYYLIHMAIQINHRGRRNSHESSQSSLGCQVQNSTHLRLRRMFEKNVRRGGRSKRIYNNNNNNSSLSFLFQLQQNFAKTMTRLLHCYHDHIQLFSESDPVPCQITL